MPEVHSPGRLAAIVTKYDPLPPATTWAERFVRHRTSLGLTQEESARRIGVDPLTLARWERECEPVGALSERAERFLGAHSEAMRALQRAG